MYAGRTVVNVQTAADGTATAYAQDPDGVNLFGRVLAIHYIADLNVPMPDAVVVTVTSEATGEPILTATIADGDINNYYYPRPQVQDAGAANKTYDGTHAVGEPVTLANDRVKIAIASGGNAKKCAFHVVVG